MSQTLWLNTVAYDTNTFLELQLQCITTEKKVNYTMTNVWPEIRQLQLNPLNINS